MSTVLSSLSVCRISSFLFILTVVYVSVPSLDETSGYEGTVSEAGGRVDLSPPLTASGGPICGYRLVNLHKGNLPFEVRFVVQFTDTRTI